MLLEITQKHPGVRLLILDRKGDYLDMTGPNWLHLSVHDGLRIGLNAPGIPPRLWVQTVATMFAARAGLIKAWSSLARMLDWLVACLNPDATEPILFPDFQLILEVARNAPLTLWGSKPEYEQSLIQSLDSFTQAGGPIFSTFHSLDIERDIVAAGKNAVIDISNLDPPEMRMFIVDLLFMQILRHRIFHQRKMDRTELLLVADEADLDISRLAENMYSAGGFPIGQVLSFLREYGVMLITGARIIGNASRFVLNSCHYHFVFSLPDHESMAEAARTLALPNGAHVMLPGLEPGQCMFRQSQSSWAHTMRARIDNVQAYRGSKPEFDHFPFVPAQRLEELPEVQKQLHKLVDEHRALKMRQSKANVWKLSPAAREVLKLAADHMWLPLAKLWPMMTPEPSAEQKKAALKQLAKSELAKNESIRIGRKAQKLILVTEKGFEYLNRPMPAIPGRGTTVAHVHYAYWIAEWERRQKREAVVEFAVPGTSTHYADVGVKLGDDKYRLYECIVSCESNIEQHLISSLQVSTVVSEVVLVAGTQAQLNDIREGLNRSGSDFASDPRVQYQTVEAFMVGLQ